MTEKTIEKTTATPRPAPLPADLAKAEDSTIRPFHIEIPEAELEDLRRRITATRLPEKETVADLSQGVQLAFIQALARYWATDYDWRQVRGATERSSPIHHRDRRVGHPLHSRPVET